MAYECENIFQYFEIFDIILKSISISDVDVTVIVR